MSQPHLLTQRRFWPLFWTQFLGAFNDNVFKNALVILITAHEISVLGIPWEQVVFLCSGIFILPFFLFSPFAGQLADKFTKSVLIRRVKYFEVLIMAIAAGAFWFGQTLVLIFVLFLTGFQSALFGPAKYSVLPELVKPGELVTANALVESGTFLAILLGPILGGVLIASGEWGEHLTAVIVVILAVLGMLTSLRIPRTEPGDAALKLRVNPIPALVDTFRLLKAERSVFLSVLGISWFWFLGIALLAVMPVYCKSVLRGNEQVVTACLSLFCMGIGMGSMLCGKLSQHRLELGLVPFGSIGLSVFVADLAWVGSPYPAGQVPEELLTLGQFLENPIAYRIGADLLLTALFGGLFSVPLYTLVQERSPQHARSRVIAGNNVMNSGFMVLASLLLVVLASLGFETVHVFIVLAALNAAASVYIYGLLPEFLLRFVVVGLSRIMYRVRISGREQIPNEGACLLVCNHVSFIDWMLIASACPRPVRFVMYHGFFKMPIVGFFFRDAKVIPIAPAHEDQGILDEAFDRIAKELEDGEIVCIFPEGKLTLDGNMNPFRTGVERIVQRTPVPVVPMGLQGMWGSFFSKKDRAALRRPFRRFWSRVKLTIGEPVPPEQVSAADLQERVVRLLG